MSDLIKECFNRGQEFEAIRHNTLKFIEKGKDVAQDLSSMKYNIDRINRATKHLGQVIYCYSKGDKRGINTYQVAINALLDMFESMERDLDEMLAVLQKNPALYQDHFELHKILNIAENGIINFLQGKSDEEFDDYEILRQLITEEESK